MSITENHQVVSQQLRANAEELAESIRTHFGLWDIANVRTAAGTSETSDPPRSEFINGNVSFTLCWPQKLTCFVKVGFLLALQYALRKKLQPDGLGVKIEHIELSSSQRVITGQLEVLLL